LPRLAGVGAQRALEIVPGLYRWTAAHPDWNPQAEPASADDWDEEVGSVLYEGPDAQVLIDPLLPREDREGFVRWLDRQIDGRPVSILTTIRWHRRDREELAERYRSTTSKAWNAIPRAVEPHPLRGAGETMYWLPVVSTLVAGDRLIGRDGGLDVCPQSWLGEVHVNRTGLIELLRPLVQLPIERVLVSHGEPVLHDGRAALVRAIARAKADEAPGAGRRDRRGAAEKRRQTPRRDL
jgi:hypothetical protein